MSSLKFWEASFLHENKQALCLHPCATIVSLFVEDLPLLQLREGIKPHMRKQY
ncbi:hypothetical protein ACQKL5_19690 [Peribacillus sp. NPDC097675]|uniref:hypothetical protein n=1 Tax=Peribacillus sp. NPDC097675 TaxID=3390618 RepID=UPI003D032273